MPPRYSPHAVVAIAIAALTVCPSRGAWADDASAPSWSYGLDVGLWIVPDESDFVQPTVTADRGRLHLEGRYNYEDRESASLFVGAMGSTGEKARISLTPMIGGVAGQTDGIVPALEADLTYRSLEAYAEAEYLFDLEEGSSNFFYMWSELSLAPVERLRAGVAAQRTRAYESDRVVNYGLFARLSMKRVEGAIYGFDPGGGDSFMVVSLGLSF